MTMQTNKKSKFGLNQSRESMDDESGSHESEHFQREIILLEEDHQKEDSDADADNIRATLAQDERDAIERKPVFSFPTLVRIYLYHVLVYIVLGPLTVFPVWLIEGRSMAHNMALVPALPPARRAAPYASQTLIFVLLAAITALAYDGHRQLSAATDDPLEQERRQRILEYSYMKVWVSEFAVLFAIRISQIAVRYAGMPRHQL